MKLRFSFALQVCLYLGLNLSASAAAATGDVPSSMRSSDETSQKLNAPVVPQTDIAILERARIANDNVYSALQSFVCDEQISRFQGKGQSGRPLDTITAKLSFERGVEQYTSVLQNKHERHGITSLTGAWSEGEFGTLLLQTQQLLSTQKVTFQDFADLQGEKVGIYSFDVASGDSPWDLSVGDHHYRVPFSTKVWIAVETGEIRKIDRSSLGIASETHISGIEWSITLDRVVLDGSKWLLPVNGTYSVLYANTNHREWNLLNFSGYRHYGAETAIKFD